MPIIENQDYRNFIDPRCNDHLEHPNINNPCICLMPVGSIYIGNTGRVFVRQTKRNEEVCRFTDWGELIPSQEIVSDNYLLGANYNANTNILTLTMINGAIFTVDMNDLVDPPSIMTTDLPNASWTHNNGSGTLTNIRSVSANVSNILDIGTDGGAYLNSLQLCGFIQDCNLGVGFNYSTGTNTLQLLDSNNDVLSSVAFNNCTLVNNNNGTFTFTNEVGASTTIDFKRTSITNPEANVYVITDDSGNVVEIDTNNIVTTLSLLNCVLTYTNESGTLANIDLAPCIQSAQSLTTIAYAGGVITYTDEDGVATNLSIGVENFLANVTYDGVLNQLTFTLTDSTSFIVSLNDLVDTFGVDILDTATINMSITGTGPTIDPYIISGSVKISADSNNKLEARADGLYVDTRIQSANDFTNNMGVGTDAFPITYDHANGKFTLTQLSHANLSGLANNDHPQYLLASGVSAYGATLIDDADQATARTTLGLGTMATATETNYLLVDGSRVGSVVQAQTFARATVAAELLRIGGDPNFYWIFVNGGSPTTRVMLRGISAGSTTFQFDPLSVNFITAGLNLGHTASIDGAMLGIRQSANNPIVAVETATGLDVLQLGTVGSSDASKRAILTLYNIGVAGIVLNALSGSYVNGTFSIGHNGSPTAWADISASTTAAASLRIRNGVAPTTPNDGDIWFDGTNYYLRSTGNYSVGPIVRTTAIRPLADSTTAFNIQNTAGSSTILTVDTVNNRVGIGTTAPTYKLQAEVNSSATSLGVGNVITVSNNDTTANNISGIMFSQVDNGSGLFGAGIAGIHQDRTSGARDSDLAFYTMLSNSVSEKMRILNNGNVGIGTTSPNTNLEIAGGTGTTAIRLLETSGTDSQWELRSTNDTPASGFTIWGGVVGTESTALSITGGSNNIWLGGTSVVTAPVMAIQGSGKVGIGTTLPTAKLMIDGSADDKQLIVQAHSTQTANIQEWQSSAETALSFVKSDGRLFVFGEPTFANKSYLGTKVSPTDTSGSHVAIAGQISANPSGTGATFYGMWLEAGTAATAGNVGTLISAYNLGQFRAANTTTVFRASDTGLQFTAGVAGTITTASLYYGRTPILNSGSIGTLNGLYLENMNVATNSFAIVTNAGNIVFNEGGDANTDFRVESDTYDALFIDASNDAAVLMNNASGKIAFYGATPITKITTGVAEAAFIENIGGAAVNVDSTFEGYTLQQIVTALKTYGLLT